jgi:pSer/pThr/pTyr-binding forkhead associated (FHA) protein
MDARCHHCGHVQAIEDDIFGNHERVDYPCTACGKTFQVINPKLATFRAQTTRKKLPTINSDLGTEGQFLSLPQNQAITLRALEGNEKGTVYPVTKPRLTIGRANADIVIQDPLSSRVHCSIEISDQSVLLRDLESTNGTYVDDQPIQTVELSNGSVFRIGGHSFRLAITPKGHE